MIEQKGKIAISHFAEREEYLCSLLSKLIEEATELKNALGPDHQREEIADVKEVLDAIQIALNFTDTEIKEVQTSKFEERGGFAGRVILDVKPQ